MSSRQKDEGATAFQSGAQRTNNPYSFATDDWTDWKDGFDQAEAVFERKVISEHVAEHIAATR